MDNYLKQKNRDVLDTLVSKLNNNEAIEYNSINFYDDGKNYLHVKQRTKWLREKLYPKWKAKVQRALESNNKLKKHCYSRTYL